jgi:hypothetical protein
MSTARINREVDIIDGKQHPELFLPTELFETLVRDGLIDGDLWREFYAKQLSAAKLPTNFWERLETISLPYTTDLRRAKELLQRAGNSPSEKAAAENIVAGMSPTLCRERYDALLRARKAFGSSLDRLMYTYVARKTTIFTDEIPDPSRLEAEERGCP